MDRMTFTIEGRPATKKNSRRLMRMGRRLVLRQSAQAEGWENSAVLQLRSQWRGGCRIVFQEPGRPPLASLLLADGQALAMPVNLRALVYRDRDVGDLGNYLAAVCDALEKAGVVENDRLILGFDGSRLLLDRKRPRVELWLTPMVESETR